MGSDFWLLFTVFIVLVGLSAFFSGSESAFFSIDDSELKEMENDKNKSYKKKRVLWLMGRQRRLLMTLLAGNTIVNVGAATTAAIFTAKFFRIHEAGNTYKIIIEIGVVTLILLIFSEVSPKIFAVKNPLHFAENVSLPVTGLVKLGTPVTWLIEKIANVFLKMLNIKKEMPFMNEEELKALIDVGAEKGTLDYAEREMIHSIFEFRETTAKEVMIPRPDMICIDINTPYKKVISLIKKYGHSRIPVFQENIDNIKGLLYVKDLLPFIMDSKSVPKIESLLHKAYFIPESKRIDELLKEFQKERMHMAVVVDEYGGTAGLVTMEDIIEEIVGEIRDEYDMEKPLIQKKDQRTWIVEGKIDIEDMNEKTGLNIPDDEGYESLGGFIFDQLGHIPVENEKVEWDNVEFIVEKIDKQRIKRVKVILPEEESGKETKEK
ncbi:hemolysin [candidate division KSB1 bacterium]|nr:MAG: hemolysin [candidate division KSB1 bacterium]